MYRIILDFDDCIFDTAKLKQVAEDCGIDISNRDVSMFTAIRNTPGYEDFDPKELVFPNALEFIQQYQDRVTILTTSTSMTAQSEDQDAAAAEAFQRAKLEMSGMYELLSEDQIRIVPGEKFASLQELKETFGLIAFVDDRKNHVESGVRAGAKTFWLQRRSASATTPEAFQESVDGAMRIASFRELRRAIEALEDDSL